MVSDHPVFEMVRQRGKGGEHIRRNGSEWCVIGIRRIGFEGELTWAFLPNGSAGLGRLVAAQLWIQHAAKGGSDLRSEDVALLRPRAALLQGGAQRVASGLQVCRVRRGTLDAGSAFEFIMELHVGVNTTGELAELCSIRAARGGGVRTTGNEQEHHDHRGESARAGLAHWGDLTASVFSILRRFMMPPDLLAALVC